MASAHPVWERIYSLNSPGSSLAHWGSKEDSTASGSRSWITLRFSSTVMIFTSPAPVRYAARAEKYAAPAMFFAPAITRIFP